MNGNETRDVWRESRRVLADDLAGWREALAAEASEGPPTPNVPSLLHLAEGFGLTDFERDLLFLLAAVELDPTIASICAQCRGDEAAPQPTFVSALRLLSGGHWNALSPAAPLNYWKLVERARGVGLAMAPLRIDEKVLHFLAGHAALDRRLDPWMESVPLPATTVESHERSAADLATAWASAARASEWIQEIPYLEIRGADAPSCRAVAARVAHQLDVTLFRLDAGSLPAPGEELVDLIRRWRREVRLAGCGLLIEGWDLEQDPIRSASIRRWVESSEGLMVLVGESSLRRLTRPVIRADVKGPSVEEQKQLWQQALGAEAARVNGTIERLASHFDFNAATISQASSRARALEARDVPDHRESGGGDLPGLLWESCRRQSRPELEDLATRLDGEMGWDDLVLPRKQQQLLREMALQVRHRFRVYETWGFGRRSRRGLGISALFHGPSGTGKTLAAEVLASELELDLYRIDLSAVVSKYIGETEKNLRRIFDAAEAGGAVLLFDEADALFGKRSEVKDSHDRHANVETSYLLQRMESYRGLSVLTTNLKDHLDTAFLRRLRFLVEFPFPDRAARLALWRSIFPQSVPKGDLDLEKLAAPNLTGGNIRNAALHAAFLAAEDGRLLDMSHLLVAVRREHEKLKKPLVQTDVEGWL